jgi:flagellar motor switch protein FliM
VTDSAQVGILRRKARPPQARRVRDGASDLWRRLLPRLATDALGLELTVAGVSEQGMDLHAELEAGEGALLLLLEGAYGEPGGLAVVDAALMTALIEVQTTGRVTAARREPRVPTAVDAALVRHALDGWFAGLTEAGEGQSWPLILGPVPDLRAALLKLEEGRWTETRVDLDLGGGKREGRLSLYLPLPQEVRRDDPAALRTVVLPVETVLDAVVCRIRVPLQTVLSLAPGQLVPLPGVSVRRIGLEAPLGRVVAQVHLGQSRGFRAVRILPPDSEDTQAPRRLEAPMDGPGILPDLAEAPFASPGRPVAGLPDIGLPDPGRPDPGLPEPGLPDLGSPGGDLPSLGLPPLSP